MKFTDPDGRANWLAWALNSVNGFVSTSYGFGSNPVNAYFKRNVELLGTQVEMAKNTAIATAGVAAIMTVAPELGALIAESTSAVTLGSMATFIGQNMAAKIGEGSTIVLGKFSQGIMGGYREMAQALGAKVFSMPSALYGVLDKIGIAGKVNMAWLNSVATSGARILLNSDPNGKLSGAYAAEVHLLKEAGFKFIQVVEKGIQCWEAIK